MRIRLKPWMFLTFVAIATAAILYGIDYWRHRFVRSNAEMVALLPQERATVFFVNVAALRRAGLVGILAGSRRAEDADYRQFVTEARFDYTKDIDALAGATRGQELFLAGRGRFDWTKLRQFALEHGGSCADDLCRAATSRSGWWASFFPIQTDVIGLALSRNPEAAKSLRPIGHGSARLVSDRPIWWDIAPSLLKDPLSVPAPLRIFAIALQSAKGVIVSADAAGAGSGIIFHLYLDAYCASEATAEVIRNQLQIETKMLKLELAREHREANPGDLTGVITSGSFQTIGKRVTGTWPVRKEFLSAIQ